jgi:uncharacterized protein YbjT (DUF2867 family)
LFTARVEKILPNPSQPTASKIYTHQKSEVSMHVIIGATGHTGHTAANKLLQNGRKVRAVGRNATHLASLVSQGAEAFIADATDKDAMTKAFQGAEAVYVMLPPDEKTPDYHAHALKLIEAFSSAIEKNGIRYAVSLSSIGADKPEKTGPIVGLHRLEESLNHISGLNVLHIRAAYFMENTLGQAVAIAQMDSTAGPFKPDFRFPLIAARDIGEFAANALARLDFSGHQVQELLGQRDLSYGEITSIIGKAVGKPDLKYTQLNPEQFRSTLVRMGMSENMAGLIVELTQSMESGHIKALEPRSAKSTTSMSYEAWAAENLVPAYQAKKKAA